MSAPQFSRNALIYLVGGVVAAGGNLLLSPLYLRLLDAEQFGIWSKFNLAFQVLSPIMSWGMLAGISRFLIDTDDNARTGTIGAAVAVCSALNAALILGGYLLVSRGVFDSSWPRTYQENTLLAALAAGLAAYQNILMGVYVAGGNALAYRGIGMAAFALQFAMVSITSTMLFSARLAMQCVIWPAAALALWSVLRLRRMGGFRTRIHYGYSLLAFGIPVVCYTLVGQSSDFMTRSILASAVSSAAFGTYSALVLYASIVAMISSAVNLAWIPILYRRAEEWRATDIYQRFSNLFVGIAGGIAALLFIFSDLLVGLYSGGRMIADPRIVGLLVLAAWLNSAVWMGLTNPLFYQKKSRLILGIALASVALSLPAGLFLIKGYGMLGAAMATAINAALMCGGAAVAVQRFPIAQRSSRMLSMRFVMLCILLVCAFLMPMFGGSSGAFDSTVARACWSIVVIGAIFFLGIRPALPVIRVIDPRRSLNDAAGD